MAGAEATFNSAQWESVEDEDDNMLVKLRRSQLREDFFQYLHHNTPLIAATISENLFLHRHQQCIVAGRAEWKCGDFNVCVPVTIPHLQRRLMMRCPFPFMLGQAETASLMIDEKLRCEAGTYAWISRNCPRVPILKLWGFGLPSGLMFSPLGNLPWYRRAFERVKDWWRGLCGRSQSRCFVTFQTPSHLACGHILVDYIEPDQGTMLSEVWPPESNQHKRTFYRSLSRTMLDLMSHPLEKIGSFTVNDQGELSLSNRPLSVRLPLLTSEGIPVSIPRSRTYTTTDTYMHDLLRCHDAKLRYQPNSAKDKYDAKGQMATLTILRALVSHFCTEDYRHGPFVCVWTDAHAGNIFVDDHYNITHLPDLEWIYTLPRDALHPPYWLSGHALDKLGGENIKLFMDVCSEFLEEFEQEDMASPVNPGLNAKIMKHALQTNVHWFWASLNNPRATYNLFLDHLQPYFAPTHLEDELAGQFDDILSQYWTLGSESFIDQKVQERNGYYLEKLRSEYRS